MATTMAGPPVGRYTGPTMPIYQYNCAGCERRVDVFFRSASNVDRPQCPRCDGRELTRVMSQFARTRSARDRVDAVDFDREMGRLGSGDEADFARWTRRLGKQYDDELGSNFGELADRADAGEDPVERIDPGHKLRYEIEKRRREVGGSSDGSSAAGDAGG